MHLTLTPSGHLRMIGPADAGSPHHGSYFDERVSRAFADCQSAGIISLTGGRNTSDWPLSWLYWRDFGSRYLLQLCEYCTPDVLAAIWSELDAWVLATRPRQYCTPRQ